MLVMDNTKIIKKRYCPLCGKQLDLKNDLLFCPSCNIYIGRPDTFHISFGPSSHYFSDNHQLLHKREEEKTITGVFLSYLIIFIMTVGVLFILVEQIYKPYIVKTQNQVSILDENL